MTHRAIALITGGNRGLGRATALLLAESGVDVIVTYRSGRDEAASVVDAIEARGRTAVAMRLDTTEFETFPTFAESVRDVLTTTWHQDTFDYLVNNAGVSGLSPLGETTTDVFDLLVDVHFKGTVFLTQALLPVLADGGRIINLSTALTRIITEGRSVYASVKAAVESYTRYLAKELGPRRITVNAVAPGPTGTDFGGGVLRDDPRVRGGLSSQTALGRVGEPDDIAGAIAALLAPGTGWITGQRIEASGCMLI